MVNGSVSNCNYMPTATETATAAAATCNSGSRSNRRSEMEWNQVALVTYLVANKHGHT